MPLCDILMNFEEVTIGKNHQTFTLSALRGNESERERSSK